MENATRIFDLEDRLIDFILKVDERIELLPNTRLANHIAGQMVRSGSAPALNYGEAQSAESQKDFIHKMQIILKELRETRICLKIIQRKPLLGENIVLPVLKENEELIAIFATSIKTAKSKLKS
ncbi:MAG TPA: four helix bundle protein [Sunxiuqinia sp.]|nr:four helix bundle protein [Sunxiuqinia sp.]